MIIWLWLTTVRSRINRRFWTRLLSYVRRIRSLDSSAGFVRRIRPLDSSTGFVRRIRLLDASAGRIFKTNTSNHMQQ